MTRNKLYATFFIACFLGLVYLFYKIHYSESFDFGVCMFKNVTGIPCPSCGTTRAVQLLLQGNILASLQTNPFGIFVTLIVSFVPIWMLLDIVRNKETFFTFYKRTEETLKNRWLAAVLLLLVFLNWIWNIHKGL